MLESNKRFGLWLRGDRNPLLEFKPGLCIWKHMQRSKRWRCNPPQELLLGSRAWAGRLYGDLSNEHVEGLKMVAVWTGDTGRLVKSWLHVQCVSSKVQAVPLLQNKQFQGRSNGHSIIIVFSSRYYSDPSSSHLSIITASRCFLEQQLDRLQWRSCQFHLRLSSKVLIICSLQSDF